MRFIVYNSTPVLGDYCEVVRVGDAPANMIAMQAGAGEVAVVAPADFPEFASSQERFLGYDPATKEWTSVPAAPAAPSGPDHEARALAIIKQRLRECDWTQLPDAPLTGPQKAAWADYRANLRSIAAGTYGQPLASFNLSWSIGPPPYPEF